jgi:hypothetical protein
VLQASTNMQQAMLVARTAAWATTEMLNDKLKKS